MYETIRKKYGKYWQLYVFLIIPLVYLIVFKYVPMAGAQIAFRKFTIQGGMWNSPWIGLTHFRKFLTAYQFKNILGNTLLLSAYSIAAAFPIPILFALMLNTVTNKRYKKFTQTITSLPHFISIAVLVGIIKQFFHPLVGVYGVIVQNLTGEMATDILADPQMFRHIFVWSGVWQNFGYSAIIYIAALSGVSEEMHESAIIDGANRFKRVIHIDLPCILPTIIIMLILRTGSVMDLGFEKIFLMQNTLNLSTSEVISTFVYKKGLGSGASNDYSYAAAIGLFNSVINLMLLTMVNSFSRRISSSSLW